MAGRKPSVNATPKEAEKDPILREAQIRNGMHTLGKHPLSIKFCFLGLNISKLDVTDIHVLSSYPNLVYVDISQNKIQTLNVFSNFGSLLQLNAR